MPYIKLYYHFVWATAKREPFITPEVEPALHRYLTQKVHDQRRICISSTECPITSI